MLASGSSSFFSRRQSSGGWDWEFMLRPCKRCRFAYFEEPLGVLKLSRDSAHLQPGTLSNSVALLSASESAARTGGGRSRASGPSLRLQVPRLAVRESRKGDWQQAELVSWTPSRAQA